jgi:hypothetical protein
MPGDPGNRGGPSNNRAGNSQTFSHSRRQLRVDQEAHGSGSHEDRVVEVARGVGQAGADIFRFQVRIVREDFLSRGTTGQHVEDVFNTDTHSADTRASAALLRVDRDPFHRPEHNAERKTLHPFFHTDTEKSPVLDADGDVLVEGVRLQPDIIDYFKAMSLETGIPYQNLINLYLIDCVSEGRKLALSWRKQAGRIMSIFFDRSMKETIHRVTAVCICFQVWATGQRGGTKALATD